MLPITRATVHTFCRVCLLELKIPALEAEPLSDLNEDVKLRKYLRTTTDTYPDDGVVVGEAYPRWLCFVCSSKARTFYEFREKSFCSSVAIRELLEEGELQETALRNLQQFCRTCVKSFKANAERVAVSNAEVQEWMQQCTALQLANDTADYPKHLCSWCYRKLRNFVEYRRVAKQSYEYLTSVLGDEWTESNGGKGKQLAMDALNDNTTHKDQTTVEKSGIFVDQLPILNGSSTFSDEGSDTKDAVAGDSRETFPESDITPCGDYESGKETEMANELNTKKETDEMSHEKPKRLKRKMSSSSESNEPAAKLLKVRSETENPDERINEITSNSSPRTVTVNDGESGAIKQPIAVHRSGTKRTSLKCLQCDKVFRKQILHDAHVRRDHEGIEAPFQCKLCPNAYRLFHYLRRHMNEAHQQQQLQSDPTTANPVCLSYVCEICKKSFKRKDHLNQHLRTVHERLRPYKCRYCEKTFGARKTHRIHEMGHTGEKPFPCTECNHSFRQVNDLRRHMERHTAKPELLCLICKRAKSTAEELKQHMANHEEEMRRHQCPKCGKIFKKHSTLREHDETVHQRLELYTCPHCDRKFVFRKTFRQHVDSHTAPPKAEEEARCNVCQKMFKNHSGLGMHMKKHTAEKNASGPHEKC